MKFKIIVICAVLLSSVFRIDAQTIKVIEKIKALKILSSTREDLRKIFSEAKNDEDFYAESFYLKEGEIFAQYSVGLCGENNKTGWHVPEWTITSIWFELGKPFNPQKLKIDFTGFKKTSIFDVLGAFEYDNAETGISYSVNTKGRIELIDFSPASKFDYLDCETMTSQ
jgi:hypothetical protein